MGSLQDAEQRIALLEAQVAALTPAVPGLQQVRLMKDVNLGLVTPLADGETMVWDSAQHGFVNGGSGFPVGLVDTYLDPTGVSIAANDNDYLPFVEAGGSPWLPSDGVLTPGTYLGIVGAEVVADGDLTVKVTVEQSGGGSGLAEAELVLIRPPGTNLDFSVGAFPIVSGPLDSSAQAIVTHPCLAGDLVFCRVQTALAASTCDYKLFASVKHLS